MKIDRLDSKDLGFVLACAGLAVTNDEISIWAARAIEEESNSPLFLYTMLDLPEDNWGNDLRREIGFSADDGLIDGSDEWKYLYQIAARRGRSISEYFVDCLDYQIDPKRKIEIDAHFKEMFGIEVDDLPPLEEMRNKIEITKHIAKPDARSLLRENR